MDISTSLNQIGPKAMKIVRVQYTVKPEYVEQNKKNIQAVMADLKANPIDGLWYSTYQLSDGNSFMHVNLTSSPEALEKFNEVESFKKFRMELKASTPVSPPKAEDLTLVGASFEFPN